MLIHDWPSSPNPKGFVHKFTPKMKLMLGQVGVKRAQFMMGLFNRSGSQLKMKQ